MTKPIMKTRESDNLRWSLDGLSVAQLIEYFTDASEKYPEDARLNISTDYEYGDPVVSITIYWKEEETEKEKTARLRQERMYEAQEKARYLELKKKFESE